MRTLIILFIIIFSFSNLQASEVSEWFEKESNKFLEIINNNEGTENENYENYKYFINKNFAIKSIAYGLIGENIINKSSENELSLYLDVFTDYLIKTIYKLANSNSSSSIILKDVDIKDNIYIVKSIISDKKSSANLYWKVIDTGSSFKIIDVIVENTSYFVTKKSEFNKILRKNRGSLEALIIEIQKI
jgi:ABC-type transporter MlaC component